MRFRSLFLALLACSSFAGRVSFGAAPTTSTWTQALSPESIDQSLALGLRFLLNCQRPDGSLIYEIDAVRGVDLGTRNSVREIGGLWALAAYHRRKPTPETSDAVLKCLRRHNAHSKSNAAAGRFLCEPKAREGATNTVALYVLALLDFLEADYDLPPAVRAECEKNLSESTTFLVSLRLGNGRFASTYSCPDGRPLGAPSPYSDGEALLALTRAAKIDGNEKLREVVLESGAIMYGWYIRSGLRANPKNVEAQGFYQWGSMAFYELYTSGWPETKPYAGRTIAMARWMIDVCNLLNARGNTAHAFEGLAVAWELARLTKDTKNQQYIGNAIDKGLSKLTTWQIASPLAGDAIPNTFSSPKAVGGVVGAEGDPRLRIDVTQHQMHALMLVRWFMFSPEEAAKKK